MPLKFPSLDKVTRSFMIEEFEIRQQELPTLLSSFLSDEGRQKYPTLVKEAFETFDAEWLLKELQPFLLSPDDTSKSSLASFYKRIQMFVESEFNRYYISGICRIALNEHITEVVVCSIKPLKKNDQISREKRGTKIVVDTLLNELRMDRPVEASLQVPLGIAASLRARKSIESHTNLVNWTY